MGEQGADNWQFDEASYSVWDRDRWLADVADPEIGQLLIAAPDLRDALEAALAVIKRDQLIRIYDEQAAQAERMAEAALARAKGG